MGSLFLKSVFKLYNIHENIQWVQMQSKKGVYGVSSLDRYHCSEEQ